METLLGLDYIDQVVVPGLDQEVVSRLWHASQPRDFHRDAWENLFQGLSSG